MAGIDRFVRHARGFLAPDEGLLASVLGHEVGGRRRVAVVATDRRVLLVQLRFDAPQEIPIGGLSVRFDEDERRLELSLAGDAWAVDRIGDVETARLLCRLVTARSDAPARPAPGARIRLFGVAQ